MQANMGNEVCFDTIVIRSNADWKRVVSTMQYDGERYTTDVLRAEHNRITAAEQDAGLFALVGASS